MSTSSGPKQAFINLPEKLRRRYQRNFVTGRRAPAREMASRLLRGK